MKKLILSAVAAAAVAYPAGAGAAVFKGTVVERQASRHVIVVASASGAARTVHTTSAARVGAVVSVSASARPDGTFNASRVAIVGRVHRAKLHGVVLRSGAGLTFLSAGRSVVLVHSRGRALASAGQSGPQPGSVANVGVSIGASGALTATSITTTGQQANTIVIQATVTAITPATATTAGSLTLSVNGQALVVPLAPGTVLPATLVPNSTITLTISFGSGNPTGTSAEDDDNNENDQGDDSDSGSSSGSD